MTDYFVGNIPVLPPAETLNIKECGELKFGDALFIPEAKQFGTIAGFVGLGWRIFAVVNMPNGTRYRVRCEYIQRAMANGTLQ